MAKGWHKKHISTKWGVAILGILLLGLVIVTTQVSQVQNLFSRADSGQGSFYIYFRPNLIKPMTRGQKNPLPIYMYNTGVEKHEKYKVENIKIKIFVEGRYFNANKGMITFSPNPIYHFKAKVGNPVVAKDGIRGDVYIPLEITGSSTKFNGITSYRLGNLNVIAIKDTVKDVPKSSYRGYPPYFILKKEDIKAIICINALPCNEATIGSSINKYPMSVRVIINPSVPPTPTPTPFPTPQPDSKYKKLQNLPL